MASARNAAASAAAVPAAAPAAAAAETVRGVAEDDDSTARSWQALSFALGEAPEARCAHAAVAWGPHRMLVHGGEGECGLLADVHVLLISRGAAPDGRCARWRWPSLHCGGTPPAPRRH